MTRLAKACFVVWLFCFGSVAEADDSNMALARKLYLRAQQYYKQKNYDEAIRLFKQAFRLWPHRSIRYNIALAYALKGDDVRAVTHLRAYLEKATAKEKKLPDELVRAQRQVAVLIVQHVHPRVTVFVDGRPVGRPDAKNQVEIVVRPGRRIVVVRSGDRIVARRTFHLPAGKETPWKLAGIIVPEPRPVPARPKEPARKPPAPVKPAAPPTRPPPAVSPTPSRTARPTLPDKPAGLVPPPGTDRRPTNTRRRRLGRLHWGYFAAAVSLAAVAAVAAAATGIKALKTNKKWRDSSLDEGLKDKGMMYQDTTNAFWGVASAFALGGAVLAVFTRWKKTEHEGEPRISAAPLLLPAGGGVSVRLKH
ncbi:MAG: tetratricopeptide repeat protein [Sedimentisphaerales bacterium]|nr:tetratricopeptide repeat protein [Sedimentisphaerales bacterium]